jgi:DNA-binding transcriptional LysR family regulator
MELRHLRYFVAVAEELHFRRAAERLHMSQPPLSQQIRQLEEEVGAQLLLRNQHRVELTASGAAFLERAREILDAVESAALEARRVQRGEVGRLAVGFVGSSMYSVVPERLSAFRARHGDVALRLHELGTTEQLRQLESGRLDVGFVRPQRARPGLVIEPVHSERIVVALPDRHRLAAQPRVHIADLAGEPVVLLTRAGAPGLRTALEPVTDEDSIIQEVAEMQTVIGLVAAGVGISLVPESVRGMQRRGVTYRDLAEDAPTVELAVAYRAGDDSPVLEAFLRLVHAMAPAEEERGFGGDLRGGDTAGGEPPKASRQNLRRPR